MNQTCASKFCYFNKNPTSTSVQCPICKNISYCSQRCRDLDWTTSHKLACRQPSLNETASSMKSIRRNADEFEIIIKDGKQDLGKGSYGCVKLVRDKQNGLMYAMKIMNKKQIFEFCSVENLKREIKIQRRLQHPHVTKLFHYFEDKENVFLILELAENGSLFSYVRKRKRLPENESFVYFFQSCLGIDYLHKKNIIHRDLKPENLLLDKQGNIKVCDFGWSAEITQTRTTFCGTLDYMAPEMLLNKPHDFSLDIWCLGILLYELIHGYAPFKGKTEGEKCQNITRGAPIIFEPFVSMDARSLINDILRHNPKERITMMQIFEHPWMVKQSKTYNIDIKSYIYKDREERSISPQVEQIQAKYLQFIYRSFMSSHSNQSSGNLMRPEYLSKSLNQPTKSTAASNNPYQYEDDIKTRVSRVSQRQHIQQEIRQYQPPTQESGFMDRVFQAFGCLNRDKH